MNERKIRQNRSFSVIAANTNSSQIFITRPAEENIWQRRGKTAGRPLEDPEFTETLREAGSGKVEAGDDFFNSFKYVQDLHEGNYSLALESGMSLLRKCKRADPTVYEKIHKGAVFYWLGMAAFLVHDYETAAFFFDSAVSEDIRAQKDPVNNPSPSFRFVLIEGDQLDQAALALVSVTQN
jgi:hypothetical protein